MPRVNMDRLMAHARMYFRGSSGKRDIIAAIKKLASEQTPDGHNVFSRKLYDVAYNAIESRASLEELRRVWNRLLIFKSNPNMKRLAEHGTFDYDDETREQYLRRIRRAYRDDRRIERELALARDPRGIIDLDRGQKFIEYSYDQYLQSGGQHANELFVQSHVAYLMRKYRGLMNLKGRADFLVTEYDEEDRMTRKIVPCRIYLDGTIDDDNAIKYDDDAYIIKVSLSWIARPAAFLAAVPGGCSSAIYTANRTFVNDQGQAVSVGVYSPKSKDHNCVVACFAHAAQIFNITEARDGVKIPKMHKSIIKAANAYALTINPNERDLIVNGQPKTDHHIHLLANYFGITMRRRTPEQFFGEPAIFAPIDADDGTLGFDVLSRPDQAQISHYEYITSGAPAINRIDQVNAVITMGKIKREKRMKMKRAISKAERKLDSLRGDEHRRAEFIAAQDELINLREQQRLEDRNMSQSETQAIHMADEDFDDFEQIARHIVSDCVADSDHAYVIDGPGGSGKSFLINIIQRIAREQEVRFACTAMTGAAADRIDNAITLDLYMTKKKHCRGAQRAKEKILIIDEISMCDSSKFDEIAMMAKRHKIALILCGDNFQLPPVQRDISGYWMQGEFMKTFNWRYLHLTKIRRTQNVEFAELQKRIHDGNATPADFEFIASRYVARANPRDYDLTIASRNDVVDRINAEQIMALPDEAERRTFAPTIVTCDTSNISALRKRDKIIAKRTIRLCVGAHIMFTRNHPDGLFVNGTTGIVQSFTDDGAIIRAKVRGVETTITLAPMSNARNSSSIKMVTYTFLPLRLAYAITIHKAQGLTHTGTLLYIADKQFVQPGMYYTAISRVTDPNNLTITGVRVPTTQMLARDKICEAFANGEYVPTMAEMWREQGEDDYFAPGIATEPIDCSKKTSAKPDRIFCFDFETATKGADVLPYLCSYSEVSLEWEQSRDSSKYKWNTVSHGVLSDIEGTPADVAEYDPDHSILVRLTDKILRIAYDYEDQVKRALKCDKKHKGTGIRFGSFARNLRKSINARCPMISAYNGSSFDLYFIVRHLMSRNTPLDLAKYRINTIMKGSAAVSFSILSLETNTIILRAHDLWQVLLCPLKTACTNYLPRDDEENQKLEYHDEIMDISANLFAKHWTWSDLSREREVITFEESPDYTPEKAWQLHGLPIGSRVSITGKKKYNPADVIAYCARDTDVLPKLYASLNAITDEVFGLSSFSFLTAGGMAWYGAIQGARPKLCPKRARGSDSSAHIDRRPVDLFSLNASQDTFVRRSIIGGRACPRICYGGQQLDHIMRGIIKCNEHGSIYLDISGMYMSVLERACFPHGYPEWIGKEGTGEHIMKIIAQANRLIKLARENGYHPIHYAPMGANSAPEGEGKVLADFFIADIEFEENPNSLEPVIPEKTETGRSEGSRNPSGFSGTRFVLGRRHAIITSYDLLLILLNGGKYHGCGQMLAFPSNAQWMEPWAHRCRVGKVQAKHDKKSALVAFWKLMANASYGQCLKRDHNQEYRFIAHEAQLFDFLSKFDMKFAIMSEESSFDIVYGTPKDVELGFMTTRPTYIGSFVLAYTRAMIQQIVQIANPTQNPAKQPALGDTDSLLIPYKGAMRLRDFVGPAHYIGNGVRSDKPEEDECCWFPRNGKVRAGQLADELLETAMGFGEKWRNRGYDIVDRERLAEYDNAQMEVIHWFSAAPKVIACVVRDPVTNRLWTKFRTKGVSANARLSALLQTVERSESAEIHNEDQNRSDKKRKVKDSRGHKIMSAGALFAQEAAFIARLERDQESEGLVGDLGSRMKKVSPSSVANREKNALLTSQSSAFTIRQTTMQRKILTHRWNGRAYIGNGITVPHGWAGNGQVAI